MAFVEPDVLLYGGIPDPQECPHTSRESQEEVTALARKWSDLGLLHLKDDCLDLQGKHDFVRVFNAYKNPECDRMIGDRRGRNFVERALRGASVDLPSGPSLLAICLEPHTETLRISIADRRDFYHQLKAGPDKASENAVSAISDTAAYADLLAWRRKKHTRV